MTTSLFVFFQEIHNGCPKASLSSRYGTLSSGCRTYPLSTTGLITTSVVVVADSKGPVIRRAVLQRMLGFWPSRLRFIEGNDKLIKSLTCSNSFGVSGDSSLLLGVLFTQTSWGWSSSCVWAACVTARVPRFLPQQTIRNLVLYTDC